jgi:hypothetical protein
MIMLPRWLNPHTWFAPRPPKRPPEPLLKLPVAEFILPAGRLVRQGFRNECGTATARMMLDTAALARGVQPPARPTSDELYALAKQPGHNAPSNLRRLVAYLYGAGITTAEELALGAQARLVAVESLLHRLYMRRLPAGISTGWSAGLRVPRPGMGTRYPLQDTWDGEPDRPHAFLVRGWYWDAVWGQLIICRSPDEAEDFVFRERDFCRAYAHGLRFFLEPTEPWLSGTWRPPAEL